MGCATRSSRMVARLHRTGGLLLAYLEDLVGNVSGRSRGRLHVELAICVHLCPQDHSLPDAYCQSRLKRLQQWVCQREWACKWAHWLSQEGELIPLSTSNGVGQKTSDWRMAHSTFARNTYKQHDDFVPPYYIFHLPDCVKVAAVCQI